MAFTGIKPGKRRPGACAALLSSVPAAVVLALCAAVPGASAVTAHQSAEMPLPGWRVVTTFGQEYGSSV
jgi:hypothetical protein